MQTEQFSGRLKSFDTIRGIGALWVLSYHISHTQPGPVGLRYFVTLPIDFAILALLLFIIVSGFCIHYTAAKKTSGSDVPKLKWSRFWKRRLHRLYPPYFVGIVFSLVMRGLMGSSTAARQAPFTPDLIVHLLMIHNLIPAFVNGVGNPALWTLGLEEQLYGLYAPLMRIRRRISIQATVLIVFLIGLAWVAILSSLTGEITDRASHWWYFWPFTFWFAWALGAFAAEIFTGAIKPKPIYYSVPLGVLLFAIGFITSGPILGLFIRTNLFASQFGTGLIIPICRVFINASNFFFEGSFFILINILVSAEKRGTLIRIPRFFPWFGVFSYSFYLTHEPIVRFIESHVGTGTSVVATILRYLLIVPICIGAGWIFFQLIEKRFLNTRPMEGLPQNVAAGATTGKV